MSPFEKAKLVTDIIRGSTEFVRAVADLIKAWREGNAEEAARIVREKKTMQAAGVSADYAAKHAGPERRR